MTEYDFIDETSNTISLKRASIDLRSFPYNQYTNIAGSSAGNDIYSRTATGSSIAGQYRIANGLGSLPPGSIISVIHPDGTSEKLFIYGIVGSTQAQPIAGTQKDAQGNPMDCEGCLTLEEHQAQIEQSRPGTGGNEGNSTGAFSSAWNWITNFFGFGKDPIITVGEVEPLDRRK